MEFVNSETGGHYVSTASVPVLLSDLTPDQKIRIMAMDNLVNIIQIVPPAVYFCMLERLTIFLETGKLEGKIADIIPMGYPKEVK